MSVDIRVRRINKTISYRSKRKNFKVSKINAGLRYLYVYLEHITKGNEQI